MPFPSRIFAALCLLLIQACGLLDQRANIAQEPVTAHEFHFADGGKALYFVLDKRPLQDRYSASPPYPSVYLFVIPGSDCASMRAMLPGYFDGLEGKAGTARIFILHKRFITSPASSSRCTSAFTQSDHPSRWLADQSEFIRTELAAAQANGQQPRRAVIVGISEGAEIAPLLALRIPGITHVALLANGGMDPYEAYRLQMNRYGTHHALNDIAQRCAEVSDVEAAERTCRYWKELQDIRHTDNLLALNIPIFVAMGEADTMVPIDSAWFIRDTFAAQGKTNLRLLTFPGTGHDFQRDKKSVLPYLWEDFEQWLQK